ncbi:hypothetical protein QR680_011815 [Steinernema hermaphroditum]|uniref:Uncharacterized protein n=1 Tax=Steinernema hermaphroditum TaxID=289476 RepID=A0AA39LYQ3_9BILA|nr:hypothetical protein QR680_011815 [Steinernema hermaphroditum]
MYFNNHKQNGRANAPAQNTYSQDYYGANGYAQVASAAGYNTAAGTYNSAATGAYNSAAAGAYNSAATGAYNSAAAGTYNGAATGTYKGPAAGNYNGTAGGTYNGATAGTYNNAATGTYGAAAGKYNGTAGGTHNGPTAGTYNNAATGTYGAAAGKYINGTSGTYSGGATGTYNGATAGAYNGAATGTYKSPAAGTSNGASAGKYNDATAGTYNGASTGTHNGSSYTAPAISYNAATGTYNGPMSSYNTTSAGSSNQNALRTSVLEEENQRLRRQLQYADRDLQDARFALDSLSREFHGLRGAHASAVNEIRRLQEVIRYNQRPKNGPRGGGPAKWRKERDAWQQRAKRSEVEKKDASEKLEKMKSELNDAALEESLRVMQDEIEVRITDIRKTDLCPAMMESMNAIQRLIKSEPLNSAAAPEPKLEPMTPMPSSELVPKIEPVTPATPVTRPKSAEQQQESGESVPSTSDVSEPKSNIDSSWGTSVSAMESAEQQTSEEASAPLVSIIGILSISVMCSKKNPKSDPNRSANVGDWKMSLLDEAEFCRRVMPRVIEPANEEEKRHNEAIRAGKRASNRDDTLNDAHEEFRNQFYVGAFDNTKKQDKGLQTTTHFITQTSS